MQADGTVTSYREIAPNKNGGPDISSTNTGFGSALLQMPDFDGDKIPELLIGANLMSVAGSYNPKAGEQYFCYLDKSGRVKSHHVIGEFSLQDSDSGLLPNLVRVVSLISFVDSELILTISILSLLITADLLWHTLEISTGTIRISSSIASHP